MYNIFGPGIYNRKTCFHNVQSIFNRSGCAMYDELLEPFKRVNATLVYAKMYGFRFTNNEYVTITCDVRMYPKEHQVNIISLSVSLFLCVYIHYLSDNIFMKK